MIINFANGREKLNQSDWEINKTSNSGTLISKNIYFSLQAENQYGRNYLIKSNEININDNDQIEIKIFPTANLEGEKWEYFIIGFSNNENIQEFIQIAKLKKPKNFSQYITLQLNKDSIFDSDLISENENNLPENPINGQITNVESENQFLEYHKDSESWIEIENSLCFISDIEGKDGAKRNIANITSMPEIKAIEYELSDNESTELFFYLKSDDNQSILKNRMIAIRSFINNVDVSNFMDNLIIYNIHGYVDEHYQLRQRKLVNNRYIPQINTEINYEKNNPIELKEKVLGNESILISVKFIIDENDINTQIPNNASLSVDFSLIPNGKRKNPLGFILGNNFIIDDLEHFKVFPNLENQLKIKSGKGVINGFDVINIDNSILRLLPENQKNIKIQIDEKGKIHHSLRFSEIKPTRAIVSTEKKETILSEWKTENISINTFKKLSIDLNLQKTEDDLKEINPDYNDVISENKENHPFLLKTGNIYIIIQNKDENGVVWRSQVYKKSDIDLLNVQNNIEINNLDNLESLDGGLDEVNATNRSKLFNPGIISNIELLNFNVNNSFTKNLAEIFNANTIELKIAFSLNYEGDIVSEISHKPEDGCMGVLNTNIFDLLENHQYWQQPIKKTELSKLSKNKLKNGMERNVILEDDSITSYIYNENSLEGIKPHNKKSNEKGRWVLKNIVEENNQTLDEDIKKEIFKNSIIFS